MSDLRTLLEKTINEGLNQVILSNSQNKEYAAKIKIRPVMIKNTLYFQETLYRGTQVFHENYEKDKMIERIEMLMKDYMRQGEITNASLNAIILVSKKGHMTIK